MVEWIRIKDIKNKKLILHIPNIERIDETKNNFVDIYQTSGKKIRITREEAIKMLDVFMKGHGSSYFKEYAI